MNNRDYREFAAGQYYHVYNRGNWKQDIFLEESDYWLFLSRLRENLFPPQTQTSQWVALQSMQSHPLQSLQRRKLLPTGAFSITCYCLMPNHFHFLIRQNTELPVSALLQKLCTSYSKSFNKKYKQEGRLFQDVFKAALVDSDEYLMWLSAYIHQNPKVAGLVTNLSEYQWSSYGEFIGKVENGICEKDIILKRFRSTEEYERYVESAFEFIRDRKEVERLALDL